MTTDLKTTQDPLLCSGYNPAGDWCQGTGRCTCAELERLRAILEGPPTDAMIRAALDESQAGDENMYHRIWRAMAREAATHG